MNILRRHCPFCLVVLLLAAALSPRTRAQDASPQLPTMPAFDLNALDTSANADDRQAKLLVHLGNHTFGFPDAPMDHLVFHFQDGRVHGYFLCFDGLFFNFRKGIGP